jgi:hypothetical protein
MVIHGASLASRYGTGNRNCPTDGNILQQLTWKSPLLADVILCVYLLLRGRVFRLKAGFQRFVEKMDTGVIWIL